MSIPRRPAALAASAALALACLLATGCGTHTTAPKVVVPPGPVVPTATSPTGAVLRFQWCCNKRDLAEYEKLFSDDYVFTFSAMDSAGAPYRGTPWRRDDEAAYADHLFVTGTANEEAATDISLTFGNTLADQPDASSGRDPRFHRLVVVSLVLDVRRPSSTLNVKGEANFFVVRGDHADVAGLGLPADSTHWYIDGWVDGTVMSGTPARAHPASRGGTLPANSLSWGSVKAVYR